MTATNVSSTTKYKVLGILSLAVFVSMVTFYQYHHITSTSGSGSAFDYRLAAKQTIGSNHWIKKVTYTDSYCSHINVTRHTDVPLKVPQDVEVVVAHYSENLNWLASKSNVCHIYHKGDLKVPDHRFKQWETLPNVGRESHTYLYHIINNYDCLANITVFIQGDVHSHRKFCYQHIDNYTTQSIQKGFAIKRHLYYGNWGSIRHAQHWKKDLQRGLLRKSKITFGEFWKRVFGTPHPQSSIIVSWNACFGVERRRILNYPKTLYENMLSYVNDHSNPEEGHYVERLWAYLFACFDNEYCVSDPVKN